MMKPGNLVGSLQKQIPKKPPPPTPADVVAATAAVAAAASASDQQSSIISSASNNNGHNNIHNNNNLSSPSSSSLAANNDQKPALPPRPVNQFNPLHLQHQQQSQQQSYISALASKPSLFNHLQQHQSLQSAGSQSHLQQHHQHQQQQQQVAPLREQARVVFAYKPGNDDELAMEVGDIINVLDKDIEDAGWWKGELNGNIGVFPDNFVELITVPTPPLPQQSTASTQNNNNVNNNMNQPNSIVANIINNNHTNSNNIGSSIPNTNQSTTASLTTPSVPTTTTTTSSDNNTSNNTPSSASTMAMMKSKLEENLNLEKQYLNNNAFYSLKRNKMQPQMSLPSEPTSISTPNVTSSATTPSTITTSSVTNMTESNDRFRDIISNMNDNLDPSTKLNHITANRPKGPNRKPPTDFMKMRHQSETDHLHHQQQLQPSSFTPTNHNMSSSAFLPASTHVSQQHQTPIASSQITLPSNVTQHQNIASASSHPHQIPTPQVSLASFNELKSVVEQLRTELRETRSEMDHHKRYIKEIVSILADERKKFTAIDNGLNRSF